MILSFHPLITAEENINCAGRPPGAAEKEALLRAEAVILPQGVREDLYRLCRALCPLVWPNYDARFDCPGKVGQALLFARLGVKRPRTLIFPSVQDFLTRRGGGMPRPFVLKGNLGGEGRAVFPVSGAADQAAALRILSQPLGPGQGGFLQQEIIDHSGRDLRVVLAGKKTTAYWRVAPPGETFFNNISAGGRADFESDPELIEKGKASALAFSTKTGMDLVSFDLMFDRGTDSPEPLFIELNHFFGRSALGGSEDYYRLVKQAARDWLKGHGLKIGPVRSRPKYSQRD